MFRPPPAMPRPNFKWLPPPPRPGADPNSDFFKTPPASVVARLQGLVLPPPPRPGEDPKSDFLPPPRPGEDPKGDFFKTPAASVVGSWQRLDPLPSGWEMSSELAAACIV